MNLATHSAPVSGNSSAATSGRATFADPQAASLLSAGLGELCRPAEHGWELVKRNPSRSVYHGWVDGQEIYLKHFHRRSTLRRLRRRLGVSDAGRELKLARYLIAHGVAAPPPLAAMSGRVEWVASRAVSPARPGDAWHAEQLARGEPGRPDVKKAALALAEMIAHVHDAGVLHHDLHCGNILVRTDVNVGSPKQMVIADLHRARRRLKLSRMARAANLAQLLHDRRPFTTRTERLRFLKAYLRCAETGGTLRGWDLLVGAMADRHARRQYAQRDRRILGKGRYFAPVKLPGGWRGHVVLASKRRIGGSRAAELEMSQREWLHALNRPESLLMGTGAGPVKNTASGTVVHRRLSVGRHEIDVYAKRPRRKRAWKVLVDCFRPARPIRAFKLGHRLLARRIPVALPLAALQRRVGPLLLDSILVTEAVDAPDLRQCLTEHLAGRPSGRESRDGAGAAPQAAPETSPALAHGMLWNLGRWLRWLHQEGFVHRDLKATNMRVRPPNATPNASANDWRTRFVLVDLDGLARRPLVTMRRRFQGLMRLNVTLLQCPCVTHAARLRMLLGYLCRPGCPRPHFKTWWRVIERWSARKMRRRRLPAPTGEEAKP